MKFFFFITAVIFLLSCGRRQPQHQEEPTPHSLDEKSSSGSFKKRAPGDLVEELYEELVARKPDLQSLEKDIEALAQRKDDSLENFDQFDGKNDRYYSSANTHASRIKDSVLKNRMIEIIEASQMKYNSLIVNLSTIKDQLGQRQAKVDDYHIMLKLTLTMAMLEKFQKNKLPSSSGITTLVKDYDDILNKLNVLINH